MKAVITGGGTGGHIYPATAIAAELKSMGWDILYIGSDHRMEAEIVPELNYDFKALPMQAFPRKISIKILTSIFYNSIAFLKSLIIIKKFKADFVIGTGGFVAGPVVLAGAVLAKKTIIHEQNAYPGITNKMLAKIADKICLNFAEAKKYLNTDEKKIVVTGNPVRQEILTADSKLSYQKLNLNRKLKTIVITGGSLGAEIINNNIIKVYQYALKNDVQIIHLTGRKNYKKVISYLKKNNIDLKNPLFNIKAYLKEIEYALQVADLIISRAGATGLAEITSCGIPSILIPFAAAAENHQLFNAQSLADKKAAVIIEESELTAANLAAEVKSILEDEAKLLSMSKQAEKLSQKDSLENIIDVIKEML